MIFSGYHLDRSTPIPLYYQLKGFLLEEIKNGTYPVGSCIPTELEIKERFQISRTTIRQAINSLVQEGWLERKSSKGTFVTNPRGNSIPGFIRTFEPFYRQVKKTGKSASTELLDLKVMNASEEQAALLEINPNERLIYIFRRRFADSVPLVLIENYLPYSMCSFILSHDFEQESLHEILSQRPETAPYLVRNIISAEKSTQNDSELLSIPAGSPVLSFQTLSRTAGNRLIDLAFSRYQGELSKYEVELCQQSIQQP